MFCHSENILFKYHDQTFLHENYFLIALNRIIYWKIWKNSIFGIFNKSISFSTESSEKPTMNDFLFLIAIYPPENYNKHPSQIGNYHMKINFNVRVIVSCVGII